MPCKHNVLRGSLRSEQWISRSATIAAEQFCWRGASTVRCFPGQLTFCATSVSVCPSAGQGPVHGKSSLEATEPPKLAFSNTIGASLYSECLCQNSESSCHIALIKRARDCYHRVMGSCWSINVEVELEAFMETMWKPGIYSQSRQH